MPPKVVAVVKGQKSLFSFFNKSSTAPAAATPNADSVKPAEAPVTAMKMIMEPSSKGPSLPTPTGVAEMSFSPPEDDAKKNHDDDDAPGAPKTANTKNGRKRSKMVVVDDDEWSEGGGNDDAEDDEDFSAASEEDDDEASGLEDTDSDDEPRTKRSRLSKGKSQQKTAAKTPAKTRPPLPPTSKPTSNPQTQTKQPASNSSSKLTTPISGGSHVTTPGAPSSSGSTTTSFYDMCSAKKSLGDDTSGESSSSPRSSSLILPEGVVGLGSHEHNFFEFLQPSKRKDISGRRPDHPEYNPRTVFVPESFMKNQTPAMAQWWQFKSEHMDTVLFFKVGKFYELFHMDADVGMSEIELIYMKGTKAHSGFPEVSYGKFASALVTKGYRVARVEQTETPEMLKERNDAKGGKKDKVVLREMCSVLTKGTRTYCHLDDLSILEEAETNGGAQTTSMLMCVKEKLTKVQESDAADTGDDGQELVPEYGVCCVDTVLGTVTLAQFQDDLQRTRLRTMLARLTPTEVLLEHGNHTQETLGTLRLVAPRAAMDTLRKGEMPSAEEAVSQLQGGKYFKNSVAISDATAGLASVEAWPAVLGAAIEGLADGSSELVISALGGALWQLKRSLIDREVLSLGKFLAYVPPDELQPQATTSDNIRDDDMEVDDDGAAGASSSAVSPRSDAQHWSRVVDPQASAATEQTSMVLDAVALTNLEILQNNFDRTEKGSLWAFMNRCKTAFGARLLRYWVCHPLFNVDSIGARAAAVEELLGPLQSEAEAVRKELKLVPDLERLLARVHSNALKRTTSDGEEHPDCRAIMYEMPIYNGRKIRDFADILTGFEVVLKIANLFEDSTVTSSLLKKSVKSSAPTIGGKFPLEEMSALLKHFRTIFDERQAKKDGAIRPRAGVDSDYDEAKADIVALEGSFEEYLREMKRKTGINDMKYFGTNKDRYQLEIPMGQASKAPKDWTSKSQKKTHRRYWTPVIEEKLAELIAAEDRLATAQRDTLRRIFEKFDDNRSVWSQALKCVAHLDALLSLALVSSGPSYVWPEILPRTAGSCLGQSPGASTSASASPENRKDTGAQLNIQGGRHPMLEFTMAQRGDGDYIPNSVTLGGTAAREGANVVGDEYLSKLLLLTGPNMGGKSTLLRQTCLIAIMAQLGCKVPADSCVMTPVDRIFTRVGASDRILAGQSTFFVELAETASILRAATEDSLCILDELGRGTATFDGTAIAHAVVDHLVRRVRCRTLFATHYHSLVDDWGVDPRVRLGHMDCLVEDTGNKTQQGSEDEDSSKSESKNEEGEEVTFLYRLSDGSSPRSYGINVARLARLPADVITLAVKQSRQFEEHMRHGLGGTTFQPSNSDNACSSTAADPVAVAVAGEGEGKGEGATTGAMVNARDVTAAFFERLVSISHSDMPINELVFVTTEMWRRFQLVR